jgi:CO dehydrogenase maturation factor
MCDHCEAHAGERGHAHKHGQEQGHQQAHDHPDGGLERRARPDEFRVVVTGKGGVGKTSLTALLARLLARSDYRVLAIDADPQMNLPYALGLPAGQARALTPLSQNPDYVEEKTGAKPSSGWGLFFRLNPDVADVVDRFGVTAPDDVRLLVMGNTVQPAAGCLCPENSLLAAVANAVSLRRGEAILLDTQAGVEHFGRALAHGFRHAVVVTDPTFNGVQVALHAARLARDLGIPCLHLVVNRVRGERDEARVEQILLGEEPVAFATRHFLPYEETMLEYEPAIGPLLEDPASAFVEAVGELRDALLEHEVNRETRPWQIAS